MKTRTLTFTALLALLLAASNLFAQPDRQRVHQEPLVLNLSDVGAPEGAPGAGKVLGNIITAPGAPYLRIHIARANLGQGSYLNFTSALDGGSQPLNAKSLVDWNYSTAFFNGDAVKVELHIAPGDQNVFVEFAELTVGEWVGGQVGDLVPLSICGATDDRVASTDRAIGRIRYPGGAWCTGWLVSNGGILTAGHCVDFDPDDSGPLLPDGNHDMAGAILEFDVPASLANGTFVNSAPEDQFPFTGTPQWHFEGEGQGLGKDWGLFRCNANANTGLSPHQDRAAWYRMTREAPAAAVNVTVTGCGSDNMPVGSTGNRNAQNGTEQTHIGPYQSESISGADIWHLYKVDTTGGESGSPVLWFTGGVWYGIGVHTNAGCASDGSGANAGTSFERNELETALQGFPGANTTYADTVSAAPLANGTVFQPYLTFVAASNNVVSGGRICATGGNYTRAAGNFGFVMGTGNKSFLVVTPSGTVTIGH